MALSGTPTTYGEQAIAAAYAGGTRPALVSIAVGDGNGAAVPAPTEAQAALVHEVWRGAITSYGVDPTDPRRIVVETKVPATAGPFVIREAGVIDATGKFVAFTALADTQIVAPGTSNQATELDLIIQLPINSAGAVTVTIGQGDLILQERMRRLPFISINSASKTAPPAAPAPGDLYIIPAGATGAWAAAVKNQIAEWNGTFWAFLTPPLKMVVGVEDAADGVLSEYLKWDGLAWQVFAASGYLRVVDAANSSTADALVGTTVPPIEAYAAGQVFLIRPAAYNATTTPTLNIIAADGTSLGARQLRAADGTLIAPNDLRQNRLYLALDDGYNRLCIIGSLPSDTNQPGPGASTQDAPALPMLEAVQTANVSVPSSIETRIPFQTLIQDSFQTSTWDGSIFTVGPGEAGYLFVTGAWEFFTPTTGIFAAGRVRRNSNIAAEYGHSGTQSGGGVVWQAGRLIRTYVGDQIDFAGYHQAGSPQPAYADTYVGGRESRTRLHIALLLAYGG